jgi:hypothetical protein
MATSGPAVNALRLGITVATAFASALLAAAALALNSIDWLAGLCGASHALDCSSRRDALPLAAFLLTDH